VWVRERLGAERVCERRACRVLGQARSTQRRARHIPDDEARLVAEMVELATQYGRYGYRRITAMLRWEGWKVNHKRVERLWRQEGLKVPSRQPKRRRLWLNDGSCVRLRAAHKNHVWSYDFVHERTHDGRAFRLLTLLDEHRGSVNKCVNRHQAAFSWVTLVDWNSIDILGASIDILHQVRSLQTAKSLLSDQQHLPDDSPCVGHLLESFRCIGPKP